MDKRFRTLLQAVSLLLAGGALATAYFYFERQSGRQWPLQAVEGIGILALLGAGAGPALVLWRQSRARRLLFLEARGRLGAIVETSLDAIISKDLNGVVTSWNPAAAQLFGYTREEAIGRSLADLIIPSDRLQEEERILAAVRAGRPIELPDTLRMRKGGMLLPVAVSVVPFPDERGLVVGASVTIRDISMQKKSAHALARANVRLNSLLAGLLDSATEVSIIATGNDGTIELFNRGAERMLGYRAEELVGASTPLILCSAAEIEARAGELTRRLSRPVSGFETLVAVALEEGAETRVWTCCRKDGRTFPISLTVTAIHDETGAVSGFLAIGFDVSKQREVEESLLVAKNMAEQASRSKSQFVANMSHEIRTPMNAVLGLLQVLQRTKLNAEQRDCVDKAAQAGKTLLGLINDVLDYSKLEAEHLILDQHSFELGPMLQDVMAAVAAPRDKALEVLVDAPASLPQVLVGDSLRLSQVLLNLMGNAIKFTPQGRVQLRVECLGRHDGYAQMRFSVSDTGIGIPDSQREQVFGEFTQAESSTTRRFGGTGLGLAISRRLVALMGGTLQLESQEHVGSRFWFDVDMLAAPQTQAAEERRSPAVAAPQPAAGPAPARPEEGRPPRRLADLHILLVEDQALNRMVAERLLSYEGAIVLQADGGASGVAIANRYCAELDLILMDLQMPDMDGFSATKAIQSNPATAHIPIIAMTANASVMDRKACLKAGMVDHIGKPIDIEQVVRVLSGHIAQSLASHASASRATAPGSAGRLESMDCLLQRFGGSLDVYSMALAGFEETGVELLDALERHCGADDAARAAGELHALKGVASTLGASGLAEQCAEIELALKNGATIAAVCSPDVRRHLRGELASYAQELQRRLPGPAETQTASGAVQDDAARQWIEEIQSMLDFGSMDALDKLEGLLPQVADGLRPQIAAAMEAVAQLQFEQASASLARLGQSLEEA